MSLFSRVKQPQGEQWLVVDKVRVPDIEGNRSPVGT